jgi:hypothetical protein
MPIFLLCVISIAYFYYTSQKELGFSSWDSIKYIPFLMSTGIGLAMNNTKCVLEGIYGYDSEFVRTPKYGMSQNSTDKINQKKHKSKTSLMFYVEFVMAIYFTILLYLTVIARLYILIPLVLLFQFGFMYFTISSLMQSIKQK